jgi:hypothetical protein
VYGSTLSGARGSSQWSCWTWKASAIPSPDNYPPAQLTLSLGPPGMDSTARGDSGVLFDSRVIALAHSLADVVLLNMWARDIGRGDAGGQMRLFERIAADSRQGVRQRGKRRVIIVLRDVDGEEQEAVLLDARKRLTGDIREAWAKGGGRGDPFKAVEVEFVALPHQHYSPEGFTQQVERLRGRFKDPKSEGVRGMTVRAAPLILWVLKTTCGMSSTSWGIWGRASCCSRWPCIASLPWLRTCGRP